MSNERRKPYPFDEFEPKWQQYWERNGTFRALNPGDAGFDASRPKYYVLDMFPYPSGAGLHVGHVEGYTATDIIARYKRMRGFNVLHPMGWDAFGLPAEQYAVKTGRHPAETTAENVAKFAVQLKQAGLGYDWQREVNTTDPRYFRWTQSIFLKLYHSWVNPATQRAEHIDTYTGPDPDSVRLAFISEAPVNWCPELGTVLANEEVVDGKSEVGGFPVERRPMRQWMLRITAYAERLMNELDLVNWPESIKRLQRNWIGRSEGAFVRFDVAPGSSAPIGEIEVFTTRPDTLYGATYIVLAPEHPLVDQVCTPEQKDAVHAYQNAVRSKSDLERTDLAKDKSGVSTGGFATNPVNGERIPIWIADYVLMGYGTGAIMAVPAHDDRDWEFARRFALPIREVVSAEPRVTLGGGSPCSMEPVECFAGEGYAVHSGPLDGLPTADAKREIVRRLEAAGKGRATVQYKLRDWLFSRQRYWGEPFPIIWEGNRHHAVPESELPVRSPEMIDFKPTGTPEPPLSKAKEWVRYSETAVRETNTMPQWAGSCWYYLRYCDAQNDSALIGADAARYWLGDGQHGGVDLYVGGTEHAVLHLLYARFWHKVLYDLGHVTTPEPFHRLINQGLILGEDGVKMSKSRGNVVTPESVISQYGADALRCYEMFMGPLQDAKPWSMTGVEGVLRFLARVWRLCMEENPEGVWSPSAAVQDVEPTREQQKIIHATIKKVGDDIEGLSFNTAISQMMVCTNAFVSAPVRPRKCISILLQLLNPLAPHVTEELWEQMGFHSEKGPLASCPWPIFDPAVLIEDEIEIPVQVNGKVRGKVTVKRAATQQEIESAALAVDTVVPHLEGKTVKKIIVVPLRLINVVVAG